MGPLNLPKPNEVEVTLLGTGGGYGESVVIKIAGDSWIVIDSCVNPVTRVSLPEAYLSQIGVDFRSVKLVICTHWHQDHIQGLSSLLAKCINAEFAFSSTSDLHKFIQLCTLEEEKWYKGGERSTREFCECIKILSDRKGVVMESVADLLLFKEAIDGIPFEIFALSPSPKVVQDFRGELSALFEELSARNLAIVKNSPNEKSLALMLKFGQERVILGGDLEIGRTNDSGWKHVVQHCKAIDENKASLFKIPHHGSSTAYHPPVFESLLHDQSVLKLAPYLSQKIPTVEMLDQFLQHSTEVFTTTEIREVSSKPKDRDRAITKIIHQTVRGIHEVRFNHGILRSRWDLHRPQDRWTVDFFNSAVKYIKQGD